MKSSVRVAPLVADEILFASVKDSVRWSQEILSIPDIGSQLGKFQMKPGSGLSRNEIRDIAHTISLITADCKPFGGRAMFAVYAGHDRQRDIELGKEIGLALYRDEPGREHPLGRLALLGHAIIKAHRARELYGDEYPLKRMAYDVGIPYHTFRRRGDWPILRAEAIGVLSSWMSQAENRIYPELELRGWVA